MSSTPDVLNRTVFTLVGIILIAAGAYGVARGYGAFGSTQAQEPLLTGGITGFFGRIDDWFWPLVALIALILAYLAYRWLKAQLASTPSVSELDLTRDPAEGRTTLRASGLSSALSDDIERDPAVRSARVRVLEDGGRPKVDVDVEVMDGAKLSEVRRRIETGALERFSSALESDSVRGHLRIGLIPAEGGRTLQ
ncbi:MAG: alkaline shock response membrane anchor protein AmaP [Actinomycetota bacterium]|nr:alkaline shock response membrane anchor protein AmaP [Actinomycetota bacterium]